MKPEFYMHQAIQKAWTYQLLTFPNPAVGCCAVDDTLGLLSVEAHAKAGEAHAEVLALKEAYKVLCSDDTIDTLNTSSAIHDYLSTHHNGCFHSVSLYVTLEPCTHSGKTPACATLIQTLGIKRLYVGAKDPNDLAAGGIALLRNSGVEVIENICTTEALQLLEPFRKWQHEHFIFFKWAQRLDGSVEGGTVSSELSRKLVHAMRNRCDLLVIGGRTVREDRPRLDARLVNGKAPDVLIYSRQLAFDTSIPLFNIKNRKVMIERSLDRVKDYKLIMIEGGPALFKELKSRVDMFVCFIAPSFGGKRAFDSETDFEVLHQRNIGGDVMLWMKEKA